MPTTKPASRPRWRPGSVRQLSARCLAILALLERPLDEEYDPASGQWRVTGKRMQTVKEFAAALGVTEAVARDDIDTLRARGLIESCGSLPHGRGRPIATYKVTDFGRLCVMAERNKRMRAEIARQPSPTPVVRVRHSGAVNTAEFCTIGGREIRTCTCPADGSRGCCEVCEENDAACIAGLCKCAEARRHGKRR